MKVKRYACDRCHGQKLRCPRSTTDDGLHNPCTRCLKAGTSCTVSAMEKTGRPRKKAKTTLSTRTSPVNTPQITRDAADLSTICQLDLDCEADATPQPGTQSRSYSPQNNTLERRFDELPSLQSESYVQSLDQYPFTCASDDYTRFLAFDKPLMDIPDMIGEQSLQWSEKRSAQGSDEPAGILDILTGPTAPYPSEDKIPSQDEACLAKSPRSAASVPDMTLAQPDLMIWGENHKTSSESTHSARSARSGSSAIKQRLQSPFPLDNASPQTPVANVSQTQQIHESTIPEKPGSAYRVNRQGGSKNMLDGTSPAETPSLGDIKPNSMQSDTQVLLQMQLELYACTVKLPCSETTPNHYDYSESTCNSQSEILGKLFSIAERFISLISEPNVASFRNLSPEDSVQCHSPSAVDIKNMGVSPFQLFGGRMLSPVVQQPSYLSAKSPRSGLGTRVPDPAAIHLVLAFHIRLMNAYEAIIDAIASQSQIIGKAKTASGAISSLSIGGFAVESGTSLESLLHVQIILHQIGRLGDACDAYFFRAYPPNSREDTAYFDPLQEPHQRRRRAAPITLRDIATQMVEEREMALRAKIRSLTRRPQNVLDIGPF